MDSNSQLILDDEYINESAKYFYAVAMSAQDRLDNILKYLQLAIDEGITDGETSCALQLYKAHAENLKGAILDYGSLCKKLVTEFLSKIDDVDLELY